MFYFVKLPKPINSNPFNRLLYIIPQMSLWLGSEDPWILSPLIDACGDMFENVWSKRCGKMIWIKVIQHLGKGKCIMRIALHSFIDDRWNYGTACL